jgi:Transcriptional regulator
MNAPVQLSVPMLDPELLRSFVAIAETGSFTTAANRVFRTPSAVSMQIKRLEETLGVSVFTRDARNVALTPEGEILLGYARRLIALNREAVSRFVTADVSGVVRIGMPSDYGEFILPDVLKRFTKTHPQVVVDAVIDQSSGLRKRFATGQIDIAVTTCGPRGTDEPGEIVMTDDIVWVGAKGGQAYLVDPLPVSLWDEGCPWRTQAIESLGRAGRSYRIAFMTAHSSGQRTAIQADLAVAPMGRSFLTPELQILGTDCGLPNPGTYTLRMQVAHAGSASVQAFADHLRSVFERFGESGSFRAA